MHHPTILLTAALLLLWTLPALPQALFPNVLPRRLEEHPEYRALLRTHAEGRQEVETVRALLRRSPISDNARFHLDLALQHLPDALQTQLRDRLALIGRHTALQDLDTTRWLDLEARFIRINHRLRQLRKDFTAGTPAEHRPAEDYRSELDFYLARPGEYIGEIGAGDEHFATALAHTVNSARLYINDIDTTALQRIAYHLDYDSVFQRPGLHSFAVRGGPATTGMEDLALDKIIIRNAFHHFEQPVEMLAAIRRSLAPQGALFVKEMFRADCRRDCCDRLLERPLLLGLLQSAGFSLQDQRRLIDNQGREWWLMRWEMRGE